MIHTRKTSRRVVGCSIALSLAMVLGACGRDDKAATTTVASTAAPETTAAPSSTPTSDSPSGTDASSSTEAPPTTDAAPGPGDFGTLKGVCGPGDGSGATDQGVSDSEILVGTTSDAGAAAVPGLNQELFDSAKAFVAWCNEAGGVNGRKLVLTEYDAKLFEVGARMVEACQREFMLVGGGMALDDASVEPLQDCGLPTISGYLVGSLAGNAPLSMGTMLVNDHFTGSRILLRQIAKADPGVMDGFGEWGLQLPSTQARAELNRKAAAMDGWTEVYFEEMPTAVDNWRPVVEKAKAAGVKVLSMWGTPENLAVAMKAMDDVGWFPEYVVYEANAYNDKLVQEAGSLLDRTKVLIYQLQVPFEMASDNPPTQQYIDLLSKYAGGASPKSLGVNGFSAWLLFAESVKACGDDVTRECVFDHAFSTEDWTGGGLHTKTFPGNASGRAPECFTILHATSAGFVLVPELTEPNEGIFNCDPANAETIPDS